MRIFNFLACLCSWAGWFETGFVGNPEDRFSRDEAHIMYKKDFPLLNYGCRGKGDCCKQSNSWV